MIKKIALAFGSIFLLLGVLGFAPALTPIIDGMPHLFGLFMVDVLHNLIHVASGAAGLLAASSERYSRWYLQIMGLVYAGVALAGFLQGTTVLGLFEVNTADNLLHTALVVALLGAGLGTPLSPIPEEKSTPTSARNL